MADDFRRPEAAENLIYTLPSGKFTCPFLSSLKTGCRIIKPLRQNKEISRRLTDSADFFCHEFTKIKRIR